MKILEYKIHEFGDLSYMETVVANKELVGGIIAHIEDETANLRHLQVSAAFRGKEFNIAFNLFCHILHWAELNDIRKITTEVVPKNQSDYVRTVNFLEKIGFRCTIEFKDSTVTSGTRKFGFLSEL